MVKKEIVIAKFQSKANMQWGYIEHIEIRIYSNGLFYVYYGISKKHEDGAGRCGGYNTYEEAFQDVKARCPDAWEVRRFSKMF